MTHTHTTVLFFFAFVCKNRSCNFTFAKGKITLQICNLYVLVVHKIAAFYGTKPRWSITHASVGTEHLKWLKRPISHTFFTAPWLNCS